MIVSEFAARIGRIRMKAGGAEVRVLASKPGPDGKDDWRGALVRNAKTVAEMGTDADPLAGYVLVGIFCNGGVSVGYRYNFDAPNSIPRRLLPSFVAEVIREDLISGEKAGEKFNEMFEWREGPAS
jgi:hypothetical protein